MPTLERHFLRSLRQRIAVHHPFDHWLLSGMLPEQTIDAVTTLPFAPPIDAAFDGRRESNNSTRVYFNPENRDRYQVCDDLAACFSDPLVIGAIERATGTDLSEGQLRIEYCQDVDGFWLEPHLDISVKLFTMLIYLSDDPALFDAGTDIYDSSPRHEKVCSAPYLRNAGLIFIPGANSWHGFSRRPIHGIRRSLIVNYVTRDWRAKEELA